jgi:signal transduction histidine kinase
MTLDDEKVLKTILDKSCELLNAKGGEILLVVPGKNELCVAFGKGVIQKHVGTIQKIDAGVIGMAIKTRKPVRVDDVTAPEWQGIYIPHLPDMRSELAVPLIHSDGELLGVLNIETSVVAAFTEHDEELLMAMADQALIALGNIKQREREFAFRAMASLGDSAWEIAHRLGNELGLVKTWTENVWSAADREIIKQNLEKITRSTRTVLELSSKLKEEVQAHKDPSAQIKKPIPCRVILYNTLRACHAPNVEIVEDCPEGLPDVFIDERIFGAFVNLFENAVQFLPSTGPRQIEIKVRPAGQMVEFFMKDTGRGIPSPSQGKIFNLLYTTKEGSIGYGLWSAKWRVVENGGEIELVQSTIGKGTTFCVRLPMAKTMER